MIHSVSIGGSVIGGQGDYSGYITDAQTIQSVVIGGDLIGGSYGGSSTLSYTGAISSTAGTGIGSVKIGGNIFSGSNSGSGTLTNSGSITSAAAIGSVAVGGGLFGNSTQPVLISAVGQATKPASGADIAIGSVTVGGNAVYANILAGFSAAGANTNADASIASVIVKGNLQASNIVAGAQQANPPYWGVGDTLPTSNNSGTLIADIGSVTVGGLIIGSPDSGPTFGIVAQQINAIKVGGIALSLNSGASNDNFVIPGTGDTYVEEVS
ncbi:MAG TPA: hypothetical protein VHY22_17050, partial [Chthoniobacteraceae bacterium]|jgi:hypothetical protein|nr:hypothetical protein [Chthoniobacteraceae bacterium]